VNNTDLNKNRLIVAREIADRPTPKKLMVKTVTVVTAEEQIPIALQIETTKIKQLGKHNGGFTF